MDISAPGGLANSLRISLKNALKKNGGDWDAASDIGIITPQMYGAVGDGTTNDYTALNACIAAAQTEKKAILLNAIFATNQTIHLPFEGCTVFGLGPRTGFKGLSVPGPVVMTYDGVTSGSYYYNRFLKLSDFNISGTGTAALVVAHTILSEMSNIATKGFTGADGFVFENSFANVYNSLSTDGGSLSATCFKINQIVLDSIWNMCYTGSNFTPYSLYIDGNYVQYANTDASGFGQLIFNTFTSQGATTNGVFIRYGREITFNSLYIEESTNPIRLGDATLGHPNYTIKDVLFSKPNLYGAKSGSVYQVLFDNCGGVRLEQPVLDNSLDIRYGIVSFGGIHIEQPRIIGNTEFSSLLKKTSAHSLSDPVWAGITANYGDDYGDTYHIVKPVVRDNTLRKVWYGSTGLQMVTFNLPLHS